MADLREVTKTLSIGIENKILDFFETTNYEFLPEIEITFQDASTFEERMYFVSVNVRLNVEVDRVAEWKNEQEKTRGEKQ